MSSVSLMARATIAIGLLSLTPFAEAEGRQPCAARADVVQKLLERFGETLRSVGLQPDETLVEVSSSERTGSWTILQTKPDGTSCLIAAGQLWEEALPRRLVGKDA
jgi:hypothetical protein